MYLIAREREDGDYEPIASFNKPDMMEEDFHDFIVKQILKTYKFQLGEEITLFKRQDLPDYLEINEEEYHDQIIRY